ncbi:hypothetical protein NZD85_06295 [Empedobacter stercoris]|uniref:hypothetical protein n=1 Tax=Empedobacter stercoris TaxID=1628248 RepID=UPI0021B0795D|nr:hypothetical protein [Empedobacter stercoris]UWX68202.1 hypothetical protein NZD85_06295 [Empedobacter stercoris]
MKNKWILRISIILNIFLIALFLLNTMNSPSNEIGRLKKDLKVGFFTGDSAFIFLPKGLTVRNKSERGLSAIGQFENNRFEIVITSDEDLVEYNLPKDSLFTFGNYYSADIEKYKSNNKE